MNEEQPASSPGIRPIETVLAIGGFILLGLNVWGDWQNSDYDGGLVSIALITFIATVIGKNAGSLIGRDK